MQGKRDCLKDWLKPRRQPNRIQKILQRPMPPQSLPDASTSNTNSNPYDVLAAADEADAPTVADPEKSAEDVAKSAEGESHADAGAAAQAADSEDDFEDAQDSNPNDAGTCTHSDARNVLHGRDSKNAGLPEIGDCRSSFCAQPSSRQI